MSLGHALDLLQRIVEAVTGSALVLQHRVAELHDLGERGAAARGDSGSSGGGARARPASASEVPSWGRSCSDIGRRV